jgi:hypothetical protein
LVATGMTARAFFGKLVFGFRGADECPELRVGHFERATGMPIITELAATKICTGTCGPNGPTCGCQQTIPNLGTTPVFLQIETVDNPLDPGVELTAHVGWNCASCTTEPAVPCDISKCGSHCIVLTTDDSSIAQALWQQIGLSGVDGHEGAYAIDLIDIGSAPTSALPCP